MGKCKAVFLDRDGTINVDKDYLYDQHEFDFLPGTISALRMLNKYGFYLIIITNQSGIARGYYSEDDYLKLDHWLKRELLDHGIKINASYYCPHLNGKEAVIEKYRKECDCRKPKTGLFMRAVTEHDIDLSNSYAIGDRLRDLSICMKSECKGYLIGSTESSEIINQAKAGKYNNIKYKNNLLQSVEDIIDTT